eukprot:676295-Prymnesium_polylepis.2
MLRGIRAQGQRELRGAPGSIHALRTRTHKLELLIDVAERRADVAAGAEHVEWAVVGAIGWVLTRRARRTAMRHEPRVAEALIRVLDHEALLRCVEVSEA